MKMLMIKKSENSIFDSDFIQKYGAKFSEVIIKNEEGKKYLFLHIFPSKFSSVEEKKIFFKDVLTFRVGKCPKDIESINSGPNQNIVLMFLREI